MNFSAEHNGNPTIYAFFLSIISDLFLLFLLDKIILHILEIYYALPIYSYSLSTSNIS